MALLACGPAQPADPAPGPPPAAGVMLLSLRTGAVVGQVKLGEDPLAVALAPDGRTAFVADNDLGDVFALRLPSLQAAWRRHVGKTLSSLLYSGGRLYAGVYCCGNVETLDPRTGAVTGEGSMEGRVGELVDVNGMIDAGNGDNFGAAVINGRYWTVDRAAHVVSDGTHRIPVPAAPFWLEPAGGSKLLVAGEGTPEDDAPGAVALIDTATGAVSVLATPRDPDQVRQLGSDVFVPAHGDHEVLVLRGGRELHWARGAPAVALAPDAALGLLVVVTDAGE